MAQDGLANLKEGVEEALADLGIPFHLKQVKDNLVSDVEGGDGFPMRSSGVNVLISRWGKATTSALNLRKLW